MRCNERVLKAAAGILLLQTILIPLLWWWTWAEGSRLPTDKHIVKSFQFDVSGRRVRGATRNQTDLIGTARPPHKYNFKIYVYELPTWANTLILLKHPYCRDSVFGTEIHLHEQLLQNAHGVRTLDPEAADFFFVPVYAACLVYKDFGLFDRYRFLVKAVIDHIMEKHPYWHRSMGRDHIWPFVHDFGGCLSWLDNTDHIYYEELRNSIFLSHLGDLTMGCFQTFKDIVIPPLVTDERMIHSRQLWGAGSNDGARNRSIWAHRPTLAHFRGTVHWYQYNAMPELLIKTGFSELYSQGVRQYLLSHFKHDSEVMVFEGPSDSYIQEVKGSTFCLCPRGYAPWSRRFFDAILLGCIPVIIADSIELPFEEFIDYRQFTVKVAEADIALLKTLLKAIPHEEIRKKREAMVRVANHFLYQPKATNGDAFDLILWKLWRKAESTRYVGATSWS